MVTKIFFDLDETLISSSYSERESMTTQLLQELKSEYDKYPKFIIKHNIGETVVVVRDWATQIVEFAQNLVGKENVYILTRNSSTFSNAIIREADIPISTYNIYTNEDLHYDVPEFKNSKNILIDNESYEFHTQTSVNKVKFLYGLPKKHYIQVHPFVAWEYQPVSSQVFESVKASLLKLLKTKP